MDDSLRMPLANALEKFLMQTAKKISRERPYKKPHAIVLVTDHKAGDVTLAFGYVPDAPIVLSELTEIATASSHPDWAAVRDPFLKATPTSDDLAAIAALIMIIIRQSGAIDEFSPGFPLKRLAIEKGESVAAAEKRAQEIEDEIAAGEEEESEA